MVLEASIAGLMNICYNTDSDKQLTERSGDFYGYRGIIYGYVIRQDK